jgi:hypothetical protein
MSDFMPVQIASVILGLFVIAFTLTSAIRSFVLPRGDNVPLTRWIFFGVNVVFGVRRHKARTYEDRDQVMALFAPTALLITPIIWVILIILGYGFIYWGIGVEPFDNALTLSGSSLLTLGTESFPDFPTTLIMFSEATIGLGLVALLISYLPAMYAAFSKREAMVQMLEVRAGSPPSAIEMIKRMHRIRGFDPIILNETWAQWEVWFTELEESHTSLGALVFFRSPHPSQSWITAAGTILDAASLFTSTVDIPRDPQAQLTIRAGFLALRSIARFLRMPYNEHPAPTDPISISQLEFDEAYDELEEAGVPLKPREQAWLDYAGWRVNYDAVLLQLSALIMAPYAMWVSDRSLPHSIRATLTMQRVKVIE